jgi:hypothetical protein
MLVQDTSDYQFLPKGSRAQFSVAIQPLGASSERLMVLGEAAGTFLRVPAVFFVTVTPR